MTGVSYTQGRGDGNKSLTLSGCIGGRNQTDRVGPEDPCPEVNSVATGVVTILSQDTQT